MKKEKKINENIKQEKEKLTEDQLSEEIEKQRSKDPLEQLNQNCKDTENKYLRTLAELENTRQRMQKEKTESINFAIENTILDFLPLIDNFENALSFAKESSQEVKNWATGFQMILTQMKDILHNYGIVAFHSIGNSFDPHYHEAMEIIETNDHPDGFIIEEFAKGYKSKNRIIRPAKVKVTKSLSVKSDEKYLEKDAVFEEDSNALEETSQNTNEDDNLKE